MDYLVIEGLRPYDGRYEFDLEGSGLTTREWGYIKRLSGYLPTTIDQGFDGGDPELFSCFAAIALRRAGVIDNREVAELFERLIDAPFETTIRIESDRVEDEERDAGPPPPSSNASDATSGPSSRTVSENSDAPPRPTGTPASASSESPQMLSVS